MKTRRHTKLLAAALLALSTATVTAQDQGRAHAGRTSGDSPNDPTSLLASESVQKELQLTDSQQASLKTIRDGESSNHPFSGGFIGLSAADIQKKLDEHAKENRDRASKILTPEQTARLNEINIQKAGIVALSFADVAEKLELNNEQKAKLSGFAEESHRKVAALNDKYNLPATGDPKRADKRADFEREVDRVTVERKQQAMALLTDEQRAKFQKLKGKAFDVSTIQTVRKSFNSRGRIEAPPSGPRVRQPPSS